MKVDAVVIVLVVGAFIAGIITFRFIKRKWADITKKFDEELNKSRVFHDPQHEDYTLVEKNND